MPIVAAVVVLGLCWLVGRIAAADLQLAAGDRLLVLAPHPDDEVVGCSGVIQQAFQMKLPVRVVWLTYGDNNEWSFLVYRKRPVLVPGAVRRMGEIRHDESIAAARVMGLPPERLAFLGYPDFSTLRIWRANWGDRNALRSMLTRARAVPYADAFRPGAPYKGEEIVQDLVTVLREFKPTKILLSHPADLNSDHRALYLFTRVALWQLGGELRPTLHPYLVHFPRWPRPVGYQPSVGLVPPALLARELNWERFPLTAEQVARKREALQEHRSQLRASRRYLLSFVRANELFGDFADVVLPPASTVQLGDTPGGAEKAGDELPPEERGAFVGVEQEFVSREPGALVLNLRLSRPLGSDVSATIEVFGHRSDRAFAYMPKLHITVGQSGIALYDQDRKLDRRLVRYQRDQQELTVRVPFGVLGYPERVVTSARTHRGEVPFDWLAWRVIEMPKPEQAP